MTKSSVSTFTAMVTMLVLTVYIFLNSVEIVIGIDLPYINAISTIDVGDVLQDVSVNTDPISNTIIGEPMVLRIPNHNVRLEIVDGSISSLGWLTRTNKAHYLYGKQSDNNSDEVLIIYLNQSWRTINDASIIESGENIYIDTNQWRYLYRITQHYVTAGNSGFVIPTDESSKLLFFIENTDSNLMHLFTAEYLDVQPTFN